MEGVQNVELGDDENTLCSHTTLTKKEKDEGDSSDVTFGIDTCANLVGATHSAAVIEVHHRERVQTKTSAGMMNSCRATVDVPGLGAVKATMLPRGSNIVGCGILDLGPPSNPHRCCVPSSARPRNQLCSCSTGFRAQ